MPGRNWVRDRAWQHAGCARQRFAHAACRGDGRRRDAGRRRLGPRRTQDQTAGPLNTCRLRQTPHEYTLSAHHYCAAPVLAECWRTVGLQGGIFMRSKIAAAIVVCLAAIGSGVQAQQLDKKQFNVVGTWNFLTNWQKLEQPFWATDMPAASGGNIKGNIKSITEVNLKGTELLRLLKQGVFDCRRGAADLRRGRRRHHRGVRHRRRRQRLQDGPRHRHRSGCPRCRRS